MKLNSIREPATKPRAIQFKHLPSTHIPFLSCIAFSVASVLESPSVNTYTTMGSFLKTSVVVGFLLLLPGLVYCDRLVQLFPYTDQNCSNPAPSIGYGDSNTISNVTFFADLFNKNQTFESAILVNVTGDVLSLIACQVGLPCNAPGAIQISFDLSDIGACQTAGPPGTQYNRFLLS